MCDTAGAVDDLRKREGRREGRRERGRREGRREGEEEVEGERERETDNIPELHEQARKISTLHPC